MEDVEGFVNGRNLRFESCVKETESGAQLSVVS
jgi:hypothetical protein